CTGPAWSKMYSYDSVGNILSKDGNAYTYDASHAFRLLKTSNEATNRSYDSMGRLLSKDGGFSYTYNDAGQLVSISQNGNMIETATYNGAGKRVKKVVASAGTYWYVGKSYEIYQQSGSSSYAHTRYVYGPTGALVAHSTALKTTLHASANLSSYQQRAMA